MSRSLFLSLLSFDMLELPFPSLSDQVLYLLLESPIPMESAGEWDPLSKTCLIEWLRIADYKTFAYLL